MKLTKKSKKILEKVKNDYNAIAKDFSNTRLRPWKDFDLFKKHLVKEVKILDIGCGNGRLLNFLKNEYQGDKFEYLGIDNSVSLLKIAKKTHGDKLFKQGDMLDIPLPDESCDIIFCIAAFHHLPCKKTRLKALKEMKRVTKKNGKIIITVWNLWQKKYMKEIAKSLLKSILSFNYYKFSDIFIPWNNEQKRYYHSFFPSELNKLAKKYSLIIEESFGCNNGEKTEFVKSNNYCIIIKK